MNKCADSMRSRARHWQYFISTRHLPFAAILTETESCEVSRRQERASSKRFPIMSLRSLTARNFRQATDLPASCLPSRIAHDRASAKNGLRAKITNYNPHTQIKKRPEPGHKACSKPATADTVSCSSRACCNYCCHLSEMLQNYIQRSKFAENRRDARSVRPGNEH